MTRRAWKSIGAFVFGAAAHQHDVPMPIFALARVIRRRMAIQTPSILKDRRETKKHSLRFGQLGQSSGSDFAAWLVHDAGCENKHRAGANDQCSTTHHRSC
jgi:hypothetical protein